MKMRKNQKGFVLLPLLAVVVVVAVAGVSLFVVQRSNDKFQKAADEPESISNLEPLADNLLSPEKIKVLAAAEVPNVEINGIELEKEHDQTLFKVKYANGTVVLFNAQTGAKVNRSSGSNNDNGQGTIPAGFTTTLDFTKARELAKAQKPDGTIRKIHLQMENGKVVFSVRFTDNARIDVDANSGAIVRNDPGKGKSSTAPNNSNSGTSNSSTNSGSSTGTSNSGTSGSNSSGSSSNDDPATHDVNDDSSGHNRGSGSSGGGSSTDD